MIRGPSRGLGTFRCRCRWILFFLFALVLFVEASRASSADRASPTGHTTTKSHVVIGSTLVDSLSAAPAASSLVANHKQSSPITMTAGTNLASTTSGLPSSYHNRFHHQRQPQHQPHGGYKSTSSKESTSSSNAPAEEGSILRLLSKNNLYIQSFPNGTVSATGHDSGYYSVLQQGAVDFGRIYIKGVASQLFLCINKCGWLYGSKSREPECIFRDQMEGNWYNTYTSIDHSTMDKSLFMAFNSNGSPCRLRLNSSNATSDGRSIVALGSSEKYALFFPVRNISFGMNLTSLMQLNKRIPFATTNVNKPTGCAPRCPKSSDQFVKETHSSASNRASSSSTSSSSSSSSSSGTTTGKEKSKRKKHCSCLPSETPAQGGGNVERCRRPRQCRPNAGHRHSSRKGQFHHHQSSSSHHNHSAAGSSQDRQRMKSDGIRENNSRIKLPMSTEKTSSSQFNKPLSDVVQSAENQERLGPNGNRPTIDAPSSVKWTVQGSEEPSSKSNNHTKKKSPHGDKNSQHNHRKKSKNRQHPKHSGNAVVHRPSVAGSLPSKHLLQSDVSGESASSRDQKKDSRLIRHRYRKIRAHPELAQQLDAMS